MFPLVCLFLQYPQPQTEIPQVKKTEGERGSRRRF
jgi:hypothetical protein